MFLLRDLPYEPQTEPWTCGAAALAMVYRSFGLAVSQAEIWQRIAWRDPSGRLCARANALAKDALDRGFSALLLQVRDPWLVLERCLAASAQAIVNHHPGTQSQSGHYSVLLGIDDERVMLHDPAFGPGRSFAKDEFLQLWNQNPFGSVIVGQVLLAISPSALWRDIDPCALCGCVLVGSVPCCRCERTIPLQLAPLVGCLNLGCPMRAWEEIFCPFCDQGWREGVPEADPKGTPHPDVATPTDSAETAIERHSGGKPTAGPSRSNNETGITRLPESP